MTRWLEYAALHTSALRNILSRASPTERSTIQLPDEFEKAWLHLLMSLVFSFSVDITTAFQSHMEISSSLLKDGMRVLVQNMTHKSLMEYLVVQPFDLVFSINFALLGDVTAQPLDISDTYFQFLTQLVSFLLIFNVRS